MQTFIRCVYTLILTLSMPIVLLRLFWKSRHTPAYRNRILERFGFFHIPSKQGGLWLHAVSVGESVAAVPIIRQFQKQFPEQNITVTTMTPTGSERIKSIFGDEIFHVYCPYDLPRSMKRFLKRVRPIICVIMETELWPNLLKECAKQSIPIVIANGCLSLKSFRGYQKFSGVIKKMLEDVRWIAAQSTLDADRFLALGFNPARLSVAGNIKFDIPVSKELFEQGLVLREHLAKTRPIWIAASTHPGEEEQILAAFEIIRQSFKDALLILVPRHPNRFSTVLSLLQQQGYSVVTRSSGQFPTVETNVFLGDTMGELGLFYAASDIAFVGGSLVPIGGHNILEPAAVGVPVITGTEIENILESGEWLMNAGAMVKVSNSETLAKAVMEWFNHPEERKKAGDVGKKIVEQNKGAVDKILEVIEKVIKKTV